MDIILRIFLSVLLVVYLGVILFMLKTKRLQLKYALLWLLSALIMLIVIIFPEMFYEFSYFVGIINPVNAVFMFVCIFILILLLSLTSIASSMNERQRKLIQTQALLEKRVRDLEEKLKSDRGSPDGKE